MDRLFLTIDERSHLVKSSKVAFGRRPTWVSGPSQGVLVLHVVGSLEYIDGGGQRYAPSRFLVLRVESESRDVSGPTVEYECSLIVEIAGIPKKPSKRRGGVV